jgi:hypothetical protein
MNNIFGFGDFDIDMIKNDANLLGTSLAALPIFGTYIDQK